MLPLSGLLLCSARPDGDHMYAERAIIEGDIAGRKNGKQSGDVCSDVSERLSCS